MAQTTNNIKDFKSLEVFQKIRTLVKDIYKLTEIFPSSEKYCSVSQIKRAATSIAANVAEGNGQMYPSKELIFYNNAIGSFAETRYWLLFAMDMGYIGETDYNVLESKCLEIVKMLYGCVRSLKKSIKNDDAA